MINGAFPPAYVTTNSFIWLGTMVVTLGITPRPWMLRFQVFALVLSEIPVPDPAALPIENTVCVPDKLLMYA